MEIVHVIERGDPGRADAEAFVRDVYRREYGAEVTDFANRLICRFGFGRQISCVAGVRLASDGFFSEQYLSEPVEMTLARASGRSVQRSEIYEVTTLASRSPREIAAFIDDLIAFGTRHELSWSFFTVTRRLSRLLRRHHVAPIYLADADPGRLADSSAWGRYYETEPKVYASCGSDQLRPRASRVAEARHASFF
ncbi:hypothetical protein ACVIJ6_001099 [Bradyrhizobium sp. USDA 4369]